VSASAAPAAPPTPTSSPSPLATLLVMQFAFGVAFSTFLMLPKILATRLGAGPGGIGLVNAMFSFAGVAAVPFVGARVDGPGRARLMAGGSLLMAAGTLGFVAVDHVGLLAVALRAAQGVAYTIVFVSGSALAADLAPPARMGRTMGLFGSANLVTNAIAPAIAEPLLDHVGAGAVYVFAAATSLIAFALALRIVEPPRPATDKSATLAAVLRRGRALRIVAVMGLTGVALGAVFSFNQPMALALGMRRLRDFFIAYTAAVLFVRFVLGNLVDRIGPQRATVGALGLYTVVVLSMRFLGGVGLAPLGLAFGVAHGFFFPAALALSVADLPPAERGRMLALANGAMIGGMALVMPLGVLAARAGYPAVFTLAAAGTLVAAAFLARWPIAGPRALP
jgi:MFS family permease